MEYIKLTLKAPLMSFGGKGSQFQTERRTENAPTKSAIVGMIAGAFGYDKGDSRINDLSEALDIYSISPNKDVHIMRDYQIVAPMDFYRQNHNFHNKVLNSKVEYDRNFTSTMPFEKYYLTNTGFDVYVGTDNESLLRDIYNNLSAPIYGIYIGRKNCTPACKVIEDEFKTYSVKEIEEIICNYM